MEKKTKKEWYENTWLYVIITILGALFVIFNQGLEAKEKLGQIEAAEEVDQCIKGGQNLIVAWESEVDQFKAENLSGNLTFDFSALRAYAKCSSRTAAELQRLAGLKDRLLLLLGDVLDKEIVDAAQDRAANNDKNIVSIVETIEELCAAFDLCTGSEIVKLNEIKSTYK